MPHRWTRDSLAVFLTTAFLLWVVGSAFVPISYDTARALWGPRGAGLIWSDFFAALVCLAAYVGLRQDLPERRQARSS